MAAPFKRLVSARKREAAKMREYILALDLYETWYAKWWSRRRVRYLIDYGLGVSGRGLFHVVNVNGGALVIRIR